MKKSMCIVLSLLLIGALALSSYVFISENQRNYCFPKDINLTTQASAKKSVKSKGFKFDTVDEDYFSDALFIGDSRTVGLRDYSGLYNADFFCKVGLTVHRVFNVLNTDGSGMTLMDKLKNNTYGKVYIMFGVNELSDDLERNAAKFCQLLKTVKKYQPEALIFIEANLHVGKARSESWEFYSNERLEEYNKMLSINADFESIFYIDINEVYDDEEGNLSAQYTGDNLHLYGHSYGPWVEYLKTHAVK